MTLALGILGGVLVGLIAGLKVIAPLTKTKMDDKALDVLEKAEAVVDPLIKK